MLSTGFVGGRVGYQLLRALGRHAAREDHCSGKAYQGVSKLESLFGPTIWRQISGRTVIDVGCGTGVEAVEMAQRGARRVIGLDIRETVLAQARQSADRHGVSASCFFATHTHERAHVIVSIDGFEHYDDPEGVLRMMRELLTPDGRALIAFGPPWLHPLGGHLFSVFPWAHLIFTEKALMSWRAQFKSDGATRFHEVAGGLNQMTVRRFARMLKTCGFDVVEFMTVPIRRLRWLATPPTREFTTSIVRCMLIPATRPTGAR